MRTIFPQIAQLGGVLVAAALLAMGAVILFPVTGRLSLVLVAVSVVFAAGVVALRVGLRFREDVVAKSLVMTVVRTLVTVAGAVTVGSQLERSLIVSFLIWVGLFYLVALVVETRLLLTEISQSRPQAKH